MENFMAYEEDYKATSAIAIVISAIGWLILIGGLYFLFFSSEYDTYNFPNEYTFFGAISVFFVGFSFILSGQVMRAIVDNTNANKEILSILKSTKNDSIMKKV